MPPTAASRSKRLSVRAFESELTDTSISDSASARSSLTDIVSGFSGDPEPTEADLLAELSDFEDDIDDDVRKVLESLGISGDVTSKSLLPAPSSSGSTDPGRRPPLFRNLFWKRLTSQRRQGKLTPQLLALLNSYVESCAVPQDSIACSMCSGDWLWHFKMRARAVPVERVATCIFGEDVGNEVARFVGMDDLGTRSVLRSCTVATEDRPCGERVIGSRTSSCPAFGGPGRLGILLEDEVSISTPNHSSPRFLATPETPE